MNNRLSITLSLLLTAVAYKFAASQGQYNYHLSRPPWHCDCWTIENTAVAAAEIGSVLCIPFLARELQKMHKSKCAKGLPVLSYLTLLDKYVLGCLFFIVLMATENFVVGSLAAWQQQNCEAPVTVGNVTNST